MKVAYILNTPRAASYKVQQMILPQLEAGTHGVDVVGIFFFDDNAFALRSGDPIGERLAVIAKKTGMLLMACDVCALERNLADGEPLWCNPETGEGRLESGECNPVGMVEGATVRLLPRPLFGARGKHAGPGDFSLTEDRSDKMDGQTAGTARDSDRRSRRRMGAVFRIGAVAVARLR